MASLPRILPVICILMMVIMESPTAIMGDTNENIGVCYGMVADNLPPPTEVIRLLQNHGVRKVRLYDPNHDALEALRRSNIDVILGTRNEDISSIAASMEGATSWFSTNVQPYWNDVYFPFISVGNEVIPGEFADSIAPAMKNLQSVLDRNNLFGTKVTTTVATSVLAKSYPPSASVFSTEASSTLVDVLNFLSTNGAPLFINVYPYFAYALDPINIRLDYAQFTAQEPVVVDGSLSYQNLFDAMVDGVYWAMEKAGFNNVSVAVTESGWPSAGNGNLTTPHLASTYNKNFMNHILRKVGTPKRPGIFIEGYIFSLFNEDQKAAGVEQNFGLFYPNMQPVYPMFGHS